MDTSRLRLGPASLGWFIGPASALLFLFGSTVGLLDRSVPARAQASAGQANATPQMVTLTAKPGITVRVGTKVTLSARIGKPPNIKGYSIDIGDLSTGSTLANCKPPKCTTTVRYAKPTRHAYVAFVTAQQKGLLGRSSLIFISWKKR